MQERFLHLLFLIGDSVLGFLRYVGGFSMFAFDSFAALVPRRGRKGGPDLRVIVSQTLFTGVQALPLVAAIALLIGMIIIVQSMTNMPKLGAGDFFGKIFILVVIRELGPLLTSVIVVGRSGSALAAYIGNMRVNQEIEALEVMGISPIGFLVVPAMLGALVSMLCLTLFFDVTAIFGGFFSISAGKLLGLSAFNFDLPFKVFLSKILAALSPMDIVISFIKCVVFAITISLTACYQGLNILPSFTEVPKATRKAVVQSLVLTMVFNSILTVLSYAVL